MFNYHSNQLVSLPPFFFVATRSVVQQQKIKIGTANLAKIAFLYNQWLANF